LIDNINPKTLAGQAKPSPALVPPVAVLEIAQAFRDGAEKYGPYNWREKPVPSLTYINAALRHIYSWMDGEGRSDDADVQHLAHAAACMCIVMDAASCGMLIDDRPKEGQAAQVIKDETERNRARFAQDKVSASNNPQQEEAT
jgi:hypothetical protein